MKSFLILIAILCASGTALAGKMVNCYFGTWAGYRSGDGKFEPGNIDPHLCTHVSYSFFGINTDGAIKMLDEWNDLDNGKGGISKTIALKKQNRNLKVLAVVGGWNEYSSKYSSMAGNAKKRARFISTSIEFIQKHGFDGLDLDWEYPAQRDGSPMDRANFVTLLRDLQTAFKPHKLILGIAVAAAEQSARISYDIPNVAKYVDFINVMTYDFAGVWEHKLGFNAPLHGSGANNVEAAIKYWLKEGAPPQKLILGTAFYGRSFTTSSTKMSPGSAIAGAGAPGKHTQEAGYLGYNEICENLKTWTAKWDEAAAVPYAFNGNQWVGYDDVRSIGLKMDFVKYMNLGGAMIWSIETDDFKGKCGPRFPLLKAVNNALNRKSASGTEESIDVQTTPPPNTTVEAPKPSTLPPSDHDDDDDDGNDSDGVDNEECQNDGYFVHKKDCSRFYMCHEGRKYDFECPDNLLFDEAIASCNWRSLVRCNSFQYMQLRSSQPQSQARQISLKGNMNSMGKCINDGFFKNPNDCGKYIVCSNGTRHDFNCPSGFQFDESMNSCTLPTFATCTVNTTETDNDRDSELQTTSLNDAPSSVSPPGNDGRNKLQSTEEISTTDLPPATSPLAGEKDDNSEVQTTPTGSDGSNEQLNDEASTADEPPATSSPDVGNNNGEIRSTTKPSTTNEPPKTFAPKGDEDCRINGYFVDRNDCGLFFVCSNGIKYDFKCPEGLYFDESISTCNWPYLARCLVINSR